MSGGANASEPNDRLRDADRTKAEILEAATREFADQGYSGARVDEIAANTSTTKRTIYYYFGGKEGLYLAVLENAYLRIRALEVFNDVFRQADPARTAVDARRSLLVLADSVARHGRANDARPCRLPDPAPITGFGFVELSVDGVSGPLVADALTSLGFAHTGQHRSKPVELWEQGDARIVLNSAVVHVENDPGRAAVNGIAVECNEPGQAAPRADALLATSAHHRRGTGEAELATFLAPDGSEVIFGKAGPGWATDFLATGTTPDATPVAALASIDHVALSQRFDHFDEAGLFYGSVLGLTDESSGEFAAPYGLVRTHALSDPNRLVRIALSVALLRRGDSAPGVPDPQHIAFAIDDVLAVLGRLRARGAFLLQIPDNYYDDLDGRLALPAPMLDALRAAGALYDRNSTGEFLHAYTEVIGGQLFFEIVQRIDGYAGYGEVNAPIRMAAHRSARLAG